MVWYVLPVLSSGTVPTSLLWFDRRGAAIVLTAAVVLAGLVVFGAAILAAAGRRPLVPGPSGRPKGRVAMEMSAPHRVYVRPVAQASAVDAACCGRSSRSARARRRPLPVAAMSSIV
jgi:hypothetical protein